MKTTQILRDAVGERKISTVYIEPFNYYETAVWEPKEKRWMVFQSGVPTLEEAQTQHGYAVALADTAQRYEER